jgi:hypothetical protein
MRGFLNLWQFLNKETELNNGNVQVSPKFGHPETFRLLKGTSRLKCINTGTSEPPALFLIQALHLYTGAAFRLVRKIAKSDY